MPDKTVYACTYIEKLVSADDHDDGPGVDARCTISERTDLRAKTLAELADKIQKKWFLQGKENVFSASFDADEDHIRLEACQRETGSGEEPSKEEISQWEKGEVSLWLCDYTFRVEKIQVSAPTKEECREAGMRIE